MDKQLSFFPNNGMNYFKLRGKIKPISKSNREIGGNYIGYPHTTPLPIAIKAYKNFIRYNSNLVGTSTRIEGNVTYTRKLETDVIKMFGELYGDDNVDGYVSSGGTEGNIFGTWLGCNYLKNMTNSEVGVITSELVHQSIDKAISLQNIKYYKKVPLTDSFQIDVNKLMNGIKEFIEQGIINIILVVTSGYTVTGTQDDLLLIEKKIDELKRKEKFNIYMHVDASIGGLIFPFIEQEHSRYLENKYVKSVTVDPHKMGYVPLTAGVFLCKKGLQNLLKVKINYVEEKYDDTLTGSRNALSVVAIWAVINKLGFYGFQKAIDNLLSMKKKIVRLFESNKYFYVFPQSKINMICFTIRNGNFKLSKEIEKKYGLDLFSISYQNEKIECYKIYIMPHLTIKTIRRFLLDISFEIEISNRDEHK